MEYLDGRDLFKVMSEESLSPERMADIVAQALAAVAAANAMGIVHRDLKPENIMILRGADEEGNPRDVVKVCDFGIAKFMEDRGTPIDEGERKLTQHGIVVGTPEYMSPEQCRGEPLDVRSDLYAMGVILYQLLTGRTPFQAETALGIVLKQINDEALAPCKVNPMADERLEVICLKAMKKRREQRYQSAREMRADLRVIVGTWSAEPPSYSSPILDRPVLASVKLTEKWLTRQPPADDESTATLSAPVTPVEEVSVDVAPPPESAPEPAPDAGPPEAAPSSPALPGPSRTQRMKAREERGRTGPTGTALMKAREERGPTGTVLMKGRAGRGPTGTVLMKARAGGPAPGGIRAWLVGVAVVGALAVVAVVWVLVRR
jgi:serine/threonine-protein kinase